MPPEQDQQETSMRDDFEAAIDQIDNEQEETTSEVEDDSTVQQEISDDDTQTTTEESEDDAVSETEQGEDDEQPGGDEQAASEQAEDVEGGGDEPKSKDSIKAPVGWTPKARQYWSKLPRDVQEQVAAREKDMAETMANTKVARQTHQHFEKLAQSYAPILASQGVNPLQATESLFQTAAQLQVGSQAQKAQVIAELIGNYSIDIETLDSVLSQGDSYEPETNDDDRLNKMFDERFGPIADMFSKMQQGQSDHAKQQAEAQVVEFGQNAEFLDDVREDMADIIDAKAAKNQECSLQEAYDMACQLNPEIREILAARATQERLNKGKKELDAKKEASSSLAGKKTGIAPKDSSSLSMRDAISDAWDNQGRA